MVKIDIKDFKSVELQRGVLTIHGGGHLTKTMSLLTKEVTAMIRKWAGRCGSDLCSHQIKRAMAKPNGVCLL